MALPNPLPVMTSTQRLPAACATCRMNEGEARGAPRPGSHAVQGRGRASTGACRALKPFGVGAVDAGKAIERQRRQGWWRRGGAGSGAGGEPPGFAGRLDRQRAAGPARASRGASGDFTSCIARRHNARHRFRLLPIQPAPSTAKNHMQPARAVRAQLDALLDIAGARRAGDEIDRARHCRRPLGPARPQQIPAVLIARHDLAGTQHDDVRVGKKIERRRRRLARNQHQGAGLRDRREGRGQRHRIARLGLAAADLQQRPLGPGDRIERLVGRHLELGRQVLGGEIARDLTRHVAVGGDPRHRALHRLGHRDEQIDPRGRVERRRRAAGDPRLRRCAATRAASSSGAFAPVTALRPRPRRMPPENVVARGHRVCLATVASARRPAHMRKLRPSGAGRSRAWVQPEASGMLRNRPRLPPSQPSIRAFSSTIS